MESSRGDHSVSNLNPSDLSQSNPRESEQSTPDLSRPGSKRMTQRLVLRRWREDDRAPFAQLNADPQVMKHFPAHLSQAESDALIDRIEQKFTDQGFGFFALEHRDTGDFLGFVGLSVPRFEADFMPAIEIGWRLARRFWGQGYASEAAREVLRFGFEDVELGGLALDQVVSFTATGNSRSIALMQRLGMTHDPAENFDHPSLPPGHRLERHVLYRLTRQQWLNQGDSNQEDL
jgi:RimJ/RimL family protein N-acetyltransferase